jgi:hypothetical protein
MILFFRLYFLHLKIHVSSVRSNLFWDLQTCIPELLYLKLGLLSWQGCCDFLSLYRRILEHLLSVWCSIWLVTLPWHRSTFYGMSHAEHEDRPDQQGACQQDYAGVHGSDVGRRLQHNTTQHTTTVITRWVMRFSRRRVRRWLSSGM